MKLKNYSKKIFVAAATLVFVTTPTLIQAQEDKGCSDLFISEIVKDNVTSNGAPYSNYVIELFNPTTAPINAGNYNLEFTDANNNVYYLGLTGSIPSFGTFAASHKNAENNVKALMDMDTTLLDFSIYTQVRLVNKLTTKVIDAFGQPLSQATITFNYLLFMQDPNSYLSQYDLTLSDLDHIDLRRSYFVNKGTPVFDPNTVIGTWAFYTGTDHTDLKQHKCVCNRKPEDLPVVGYLTSGKTINEKLSLGNNIDALDLQIAGGSASTIYLSQSLLGGNALVNTHIRYNSSSFNSVSCTQTIGSANCDYARTLNNVFTGTKNIFSVIQTAQMFDYTVDNASAQHNITITGNSTVGVKEYSYDILPINVYPTVTADILKVSGNIDCKYRIISPDGKLVKEGDFYNVEIIDVSNLANGMYIINFYNYSGTKTDKFIKQ